MTETNTISKLQFRPLTIGDKVFYESFLPDGNERGCEFAFATLYTWGKHNYAVLDGRLILFSRYGKYTVYPYPLGKGDIKPVIDAVILDSKERGVQCRISGIPESAKKLLEESYPGMFTYRFNEGSFDYVYDINDLAELKGKRYHGKRNHLYRFRDAHPDYAVKALCADNLSLAKQMTDSWYKYKAEENPDSDFGLEYAALQNAFENYAELGIEGLVLTEHEKVLAVTLGSRLYGDIFDVNFEKAAPETPGAYTAINYEFARYIREKYPDIRYLNREEDMGIEGLRRAKKSYYPHHMVEKYQAVLNEEQDKN